MDKQHPLSPPCLACQLTAAQSSDTSNSPPHTCQEATGGQRREECAGIGYNDMPSDDIPSTSDLHTPPPSAATSPNSQALDEPFNRDLLSVLNACTRIHYEQNGHTSRINDSTFSNAMNSYLESGGDRNVGNVYETARAVSNASHVEGYGYDYGYAVYPMYLRTRATRDVSVNTDNMYALQESDQEAYDVEKYELEEVEEEDEDETEVEDEGVDNVANKPDIQKDEPREDSKNADRN